MFDFFKKKEKVMEVEKTPKVKSLQEYDLEELLQGNESYKLFYWNLKYKDGSYKGERILPLQKWEDVEKTLNIVVEKYDSIEEGYVIIEIKDDEPSYVNDEIASLKIQIKHGYMRPYMKYRAEGAVEAEEWKEYVGQRPSDENNEPIYDKDFEFGWDSVPIYNLTKDINLVKTIFKVFYETGDVSEEYMH
jgi:hypothetical protein